MGVSPIECPACRAALPSPQLNREADEPCPACRRPLRAFAFPALYRPPENATRAAASVPGDATCYAHADHAAQSACDRCGRFMCGLCDVDLGGRHLCPACLDIAREKTDRGRFEARSIRYDGLALALAFWPGAALATWFLTIFTAPAALFLTIRFWGRPLSILPRSRVRFVFAFLLSLAQIVGWIVLIYTIVQNATKTGGH